MSNILNNIKKGSLECRVGYIFKNEIEFLIKNPRIIKVIQTFFGYKEPPETIKEIDQVAWRDLIYKNDIAISYLSVRKYDIGINLFDNTNQGEQILRKLIKEFETNNLTTAIDTKDIFNFINKEMYHTRFRVKLDFNIDDLIDNRIIHIVEKFMGNKYDNTNREILPYACGIMSERLNDVSKSKFSATLGFLLSCRNQTDKKENIYQIETDIPYDSTIQLLERINITFSKRS